MVSTVLINWCERKEEKEMYKYRMLKRRKVTGKMMHTSRSPLFGESD